MSDTANTEAFKTTREKFLGLSLESTRKSYYPQLRAHLDAVRENERRLQLLTDNLPARISYADAAERYVFVNREYEKAFGLRRDQIVGRPLKAILGAANYAKAEPHIRKALAGEHVRFETEFIGRNGDLTWFEVNYVPDIGREGSVAGFYDLTIDLTDQKRAEEEKMRLETKLQQAQKMEAVGTLAGGIAHDFNNLLMGIQGRTSLMLADLDPGHPHYEYLEGIEYLIRSATELTRQLLGFARGGKYEVKPIDLNELARESSSLFGRTRKEIQIHLKLREPLPAVEADLRQIEQVLLNIYVNAWQAMPSGGTIYIETACVELDETDCAPHQVAAGRYVRLSITDTGIGMDEMIQQRIFDPFFTTKEKGRGTGLGLASAYGIIRNHSGMITVYSEEGHGSTFNIYLPAVDKTAHREVVVSTTPTKGSETVLLVDDEEIVVDVGRAMLERLGYTVLTAGSGGEALDHVHRQGGEIDLVILDLIMPEMDGGETFDRIRRAYPEMRILLSSGYALNGQADKVMRRGCDGFIQKPFNLSELSNRIRGILDRP